MTRDTLQALIAAYVMVFVLAMLIGSSAGDEAGWTITEICAGAVLWPIVAIGVIVIGAVRLIKRGWKALDSPA